MKTIGDRFLQEGETCALDLRQVCGYNIVNLEEGEKNADYYPPVFLPGKKLNPSEKQYFTIVKHLSNGLLLDMFSGEIIHTQFYSGDFLVGGTDRFKNLSDFEQKRIELYCSLYQNLTQPNSKSEFNKLYISLMNSPLVVDPTTDNSPFFELDNDLYVSISNQSSSEIMELIKEKKIQAQKQLSESYNQNLSYIQGVYSFLESDKKIPTETHFHR